MWSAYSPDSSENHAMRLPSGDQAGSRSASQIADITFLSRHRDDLTMYFERRARSGRRDGSIEDALGLQLLVVRQYFRKLAGNPNGNGFCFSGLQIQQV